MRETGGRSDMINHNANVFNYQSRTIQIDQRRRPEAADTDGFLEALGASDKTSKRFLYSGISSKS